MKETDSLEITEQAKKCSPICYIPWQQLMIEANGTVQPCAYRGNYTNFTSIPPLGNVNNQTIDEIWNGEEAQKLRRNMANGDLEAAGCANCLALKQGQPLGLEFDEDYLKEKPPFSRYALNIIKKKEEIEAGKEILESKVTVLYLTPSHKCNLRCTHCYQNLVRNVEIKSERNESLKNEIKELIPYLSDIIPGGGEPLMLPFWRELIKDFIYLKELNNYLRFRVTTNATILFPDILDSLSKFKRINIVVSMDGSNPEIFDNIRGKGRFKIVDRNLDILLNLVRKIKAYHSASNLVINFSVMKDNILDLPNIIMYCAKKGIGYNLQPVVAYPASQSLRCFNNAPKQMLGYKQAIELSIEVLNDTFFPSLEHAENPQYDFRSLYLGHIEALRNLIPFHLLDNKFFLYSGKLPDDVIPTIIWIKRYGIPASSPDNKLIIVFHASVNGILSTEAHFYAELDEEYRYEVLLPHGKYGGTVLDHRSVIIANPCFFINV